MGPLGIEPPHRAEFALDDVFGRVGRGDLGDRDARRLEIVFERALGAFLPQLRFDAGAIGNQRLGLTGDFGQRKGAGVEAVEHIAGQFEGAELAQGDHVDFESGAHERGDGTDAIALPIFDQAAHSAFVAQLAEQQER